jgi:hypothetical protein
MKDRSVEIVEIRHRALKQRQAGVVSSDEVFGVFEDRDTLLEIIEERREEFLRMESAWRRNVERLERNRSPLRKCLSEALEQLRAFKDFYDDGFLGDIKDAAIKSNRSQLAKLILKIKKENQE